MDCQITSQKHSNFLSKLTESGMAGVLSEYLSLLYSTPTQPSDPLSLLQSFATFEGEKSLLQLKKIEILRRENSLLAGQIRKLEFEVSAARRCRAAQMEKERMEENARREKENRLNYRQTRGE